MNAHQRRVALRALDKAVPFAIQWMNDRAVKTSFSVRMADGSRAFFDGVIPSAPTRPRWARRLSRGQWLHLWNEASWCADFSRRMDRVARYRAAVETEKTDWDAMIDEVHAEAAAKPFVGVDYAQIELRIEPEGAEAIKRQVREDPTYLASISQRANEILVALRAEGSFGEES